VTVEPSDAFALFYKNNSGPVLRALLAGTLNRTAAEDATAEALGKTTGAVKALQHRGLSRLAVVLGLRGPGRSDAAAGLRAPWRPPPSHRADGPPGREQGPAARPD
jgi:hypothetical protein